MLYPTHKCFRAVLCAACAGEKAAAAAPSAAVPARRVVLQKAMVKTKMMGALRRFSRAVQKSVSEESVAKGPHSASQRLQCTTSFVGQHEPLLPAVCLPLKSSPPPPFTPTRFCRSPPTVRAANDHDSPSVHQPYQYKQAAQPG